MGLLRNAAFLLAVSALASAQMRWTARVVDQNDTPVAQARVSVRQPNVTPIETSTSPTGEFHVAVPLPGNYLVSVSRPGYFALKDTPIAITAGGPETVLVLNTQQEVFQSVTVGAMPNAVDPAETEREQRLSGTQINDIPYPASHSLRNSMKLIPGVVQDPTGALHFHGGAEYQTQYKLNGFDITDPITGRYNTLLAVEGVQSLDLQSARQSAQYGRGSAGTLNIQTDNGTDQFRYTASNFIPGVDKEGGGIHMGDWTPRAVVSGPIVKGRAWFSDSLNGEYNSGYTPGLPNGQNLNTTWVLGNLLHGQVNLNSANILYTDLLSDFDHQAHFGLGPLDPISTTQGLSNHEWLIALKDLQTWYGGTLFEVGVSRQSVYHRNVPEGTLPYLVTPNGRSGNYFVDALQNGTRKQVFVHFFPRARHLLGSHQLEIGGDGQRLDYSARFLRTSLRQIGLNGLPVFETSFRGSGAFDRPNAIASVYASDRWQPRKDLTIEAGWRADWDELVRHWGLSPRIALAWVPAALPRTRFNAGYAVLHDATNLAVFARPLDQQAVTTLFNAAGEPQAPLVTTFVTGHDLRLPRYVQWSAGADRDFGHGISGRVEWMRRHGGDGFVYAPVSGPLSPGGVNIQPTGLAYGFGGTYALTNQRHDSYDELAFTARQSFGDQYGWLASYTHSRAVSNAVLDISVDQPLQVTDNFGPVPWDTPHRLMGWAYLPTPWQNWAVAVLADYRTGFPFTITDPAGMVVGAVDAHRYPDNFDLNLHIERRFTFHGFRLGLRLGVNNLTNHRNPTAVDAVVGSPQYLQYFGDEGRHFVVRIRWFGKAGK